MPPDATAAALTPAPLSPLGQAALHYATEYGWAVFPLGVRGKLPLIGRDAGGRGFLDATTDAEQIAAWWTAAPNANVGIATGAASGFVVVDVDGPEGDVALRAYTLPPCPVSSTGKGRHLLFRRPADGLRNSAKKLGPMLDVRADGGYIVAPPSVHPDGGVYTWTVAPEFCDPPELPPAVLARLVGAPPAQPDLRLVTGEEASEQVRPDPFSPPAPAPVASIAAAPIPEGARNQTLAQYAGRCLALGMSELETLAIVQGVNREQGRPPLDRAEVERIVASIAAAERRQYGTARQRPNVTIDVSAPPTAVAASATIRCVDRSAFADLATKNAAPIDALPTMLPGWNDACRGFGGAEGLARGWHITVGGASGTGKSLFALNVAVSAILNGARVAYVSLEMSTDQLLSRILAIFANRPVRELEPGRFYSGTTYHLAAEQFAEHCERTGAGLYISERPSQELPAITTEMRRAVDDGCRLIVLDYLQLVHVPGSQGLEEQTRRASQLVQRTAFESDVTTIGLSQYNRSMSFNKDAPPNAHGLTGSSAIENDSDQVVLLDHSSVQRHGAQVDTNLLIAKNRHGPVPTLPVRWDYTNLTITQRTPATDAPRGPSPVRSAHPERAARSGEEAA